jgi:ATP-dependent Clp protease ATP-binding subunit ClpA
VIQRAVIHVQSSGREEVTGANVLVAIFAERESHAAYFLQEQDMTRYDAVNYISHGIAKRPGASEAGRCAAPRRSPSSSAIRRADQGNDADKDKKKKERARRLLRQPQRKARDGKIDPLIGREAEINRTIQILCRRSEEQPAAGRRSRRRQDRDRRRSGQRSSKARCRKCWRTRPCSRSTWARCWPARAIAAISRNA